MSIPSSLRTTFLRPAVAYIFERRQGQQVRLSSEKPNAPTIVESGAALRKVPHRNTCGFVSLAIVRNGLAFHPKSSCCSGLVKLPPSSALFSCHSKQGPRSVVSMTLKRSQSINHSRKQSRQTKWDVRKSSSFSPSIAARSNNAIDTGSTGEMGIQHTVVKDDVRPLSKRESISPLSAIPRKVSVNGIAATKPGKARVSRRQHMYSAKSSDSNPATDATPIGKRQRRESTAWHDADGVATLVNKPNEEDEVSTTLVTKPKEKDVLSTHALTSASSIREAEFTEWDEDPNTRRHRYSLLLLSWVAVFVFAAIPGVFTVVYSTTFPDATAIEWYCSMPPCCFAADN